MLVSSIQNGSSSLSLGSGGNVLFPGKCASDGRSWFEFGREIIEVFARFHTRFLMGKV